MWISVGICRLPRSRRRRAPSEMIAFAYRGGRWIGRKSPASPTTATATTSRIVRPKTYQAFQHTKHMYGLARNAPAQERKRMKTKLLPLLRDAVWIAYFISILLSQSIPSFVLMASLGVVYLLHASFQDGDGAERGYGSVRMNRILGTLLIACSVIPLAVMAYR